MEDSSSSTIEQASPGRGGGLGGPGWGREPEPKVKLDLARLIRGTPMEGWAVPGNEEFLREVTHYVRVLLREEEEQR